MLKSKWLQIRSDAAPKEALRLLGQAQFTAESGSGFDPISREPSFIHSRHIERVTTTEKVVDPFGETSELQTVRYAITIFRMHHSANATGAYLLEISNPSRTVRPLISALSGAFGGMSVVEPEWPVLDLYKIVKRSSPRARVVRLRACGVSLSETTSSRVDLISSENAVVDFRAAFPKAMSKIDKIRIEKPFIDQPGPLELSVNGTCGFEEGAEHLVRELILGASMGLRDGS